MRTLSLATIFALALAAPSTAAADFDDEVKYPDPKAPFTAFTPAQQWMLDWGSWQLSRYGYGTLAGQLLFADEMGDRFSEMGRAALVLNCFRNKDEASKAIFEWAVCSTDVKALDMGKFKQELAAAKLQPETAEKALKQATEAYENAKKIVDQLDGEAKSDKGLQLLAKLVDNAKADWKSYIDKNKAAYDRYLALKDGVRSGKTNHPAFQGCFEAIAPVWTKHVNATNKRIPWDVGRDVAVAYMRYLGASIEGYVLATSFGACAWSNSEEGEAPFTGVATTEFGGAIHAGWRTHALSKLLDEENVKPKFADRSYRLETFQWKYGVSFPGVNQHAAIMTPSDGVIAKLVDNKDGTTKVSFKGDKVEACLKWADSNKVSSISSSGNVNYEKKCLKRGMVDNETTAVNVPTRYLSGVKPGHNITIVRGFPIVAWTGKKVTMLYGAAIK